jgi:hypothetical protein
MLKIRKKTDISLVNLFLLALSEKNREDSININGKTKRGETVLDACQHNPMLRGIMDELCQVFIREGALPGVTLLEK